jgi:hypothetical protein
MRSGRGKAEGTRDYSSAKLDRIQGEGNPTLALAKKHVMVIRFKGDDKPEGTSYKVVVHLAKQVGKSDP